MNIVRTKEDLIKIIAPLKECGRRIGFVPTMGALHEGHLSLVKKAREYGDFIVVSIFLNPKQFAPNEDFANYPRTEAEDMEKLKNHADMVYIPSTEEIYPQGFFEEIAGGKLGDMLEGKFRPGFFTGVATVVNQLFKQVKPDIAVFGEKDYQQLQVIKKLVREKNIPVKIISCATLREEDGLAMSSRNRYLGEKERKIAPNLYKTLNEAAGEIRKGGDVKEILMAAKDKLISAGFAKIDYIELVDPDNMENISVYGKPARLVAAAWLGKTRLIDNIAV